MNGTGVGLVIGLIYGAALGIIAYRWWAAQQKSLDWRFERLEGRIHSMWERQQAATTEAPA